MRTRRDTVVLGLIWAAVIVVALLLGPSTNDAAGVGQTAAGVGFALTGLYLWVRSLRGRGRLILSSPGGAEPGSVTLRWLKVVAAILLWIAGSVLALVAHVPDALAFWLGALLPLAVFLPGRLRRFVRDLRRWPGPRSSRRSRR